MNYSEELKKQETKLINIKAQTMAKKHQFEEMLEKRKKAEEEVQSQFGISLNQVTEELTKCENELKLAYETLATEIKEIESELENIK
jgi:hypothetical protein